MAHRLTPEQFAAGLAALNARPAGPGAWLGQLSTGDLVVIRDPHHLYQQEGETAVTSPDQRTPPPHVLLNALTPDQARLYDDVLGLASWSGIDTKTVLDGAEATSTDKAAVADALGGPGAGTAYLAERDQDHQAAQPVDEHDDGWEL